MRELADQACAARCQHRQPLGQFGALGDFGMRDEAGQDTVKQIDMIGPEARAHPAETGRLIRRAASARRFGRRHDTISSSSGSAKVAATINSTQTSRLARFWAI